RLPYAAKALAWAGALSLLLLAYPIWFLLRGPAHIVGPIQPTPQAYRANLLGPVIPTRAQLLTTAGLRHLSRDFANSENGSYLGVPLISAAVAGVVWMRRNAVVRMAALLAAIAFVLSLGGALAIAAAPASNIQGDAVGRIPLPEALIGHLPLLHNVIPSRYAM